MSARGPLERRVSTIACSRSETLQRWTWLAGALALLATLAAAPQAAAANPASAAESGAPGSVKASMRWLLADLKTLMATSLNERSGTPPTENDATDAALVSLGERSAALAEHAPQFDMDFLASVLDQYAWWLRIAYREGEREAFDQLLGEAIDTCIACHTRLPSAQDSPLAEDFVSSRTMRALPASRRYPLLIATRRFGDALDALEDAFAAPFRDWPSATAALRRYVLTAVRVRHEYGRAARTLDDIAARDDVPAPMRRDAKAWSATLRSEAAVAPAASQARPAGGLERARKRIARAESDPLPESALFVAYAIASAELHDYVSFPGAPALDAGAVSEAAYLLGLSYHSMAISEALPQSELYLEYSILTDPGSEWAEDALSLLSLRVVEAYGDANARLPEDVEAHMTQLEQLVSRSTKAR